MWNIKKTYENQSHKNRIDEVQKTKVDAQLSLTYTARAWARNGGLVKKETKNMLIVEEADGSETIIYTIEKKD